MLTRRKFSTGLCTFATASFFGPQFGLAAPTGRGPEKNNVSVARSGALKNLVEELAGSDAVKQVSLSIFDATTQESFHAAAGSYNGKQMSADTPYFIASTSKLFATTLTLQLVDEGKLDLDQPASSYLPPNFLDGAHIWKKTDYSHKITVRQLMAHTSGLPDYFEGKRNGERPVGELLLEGQDQKWSVEDTIAVANRLQTPHFAPGTSGKALYSDTNYQVLAKIVEHVRNDRLEKLVSDFITSPLGLDQTYLFREGDTRNSKVVPLINGDRVLQIPQGIESTRLDGGMVSSSQDSLVFIHAFWNGKLFNQKHLATMQDWNDIFFPMQYGTGLMRFNVPWFFMPFQDRPEFIGHSGISGAFAFYSPTDKKYLAGTLNQLADRQLPFRAMIRALSV